MKYISTRGGDAADGEDAALGLPQNGGLFVPSEFPALNYTELLGLDYPSRVKKTLGEFFDFDLSKADDLFDAPDPAPVVKIDDNAFFLELWHGATRSFGDMSAAALPTLLGKAKEKKGDKTKTLLPVATSGDYGVAALSAFADTDFDVCAFYPADGISDTHKAELLSFSADNVRVVGVNGSLDETVSAVKRAMSDEGLASALSANNMSLSTANTSGICSIAAQIAYCYSAYCDLVDSGEIKPGEKIDVVAPTAGLCNITAAYYAKRMGLPINKLVCACTVNSALADFVDTGVFDTNRVTDKTDMPEPDVGVPDNLERIVFETSGRNAELTASRMRELEETGRYSLTPEETEALHDLFAADIVDDEEIVDAIADAFDEYGYLVDPDTAAAYAVALNREFVRPTVVFSLADPFKYTPEVLSAIVDNHKYKNVSDMLKRLEDETATDACDYVKNVLVRTPSAVEVVSPSAVVSYITDTYAKRG